MYADDLVILSEDPRGLQNSLNNLDKYCSTWKLDVNLNKTKVLKFQQNGHVCKKSFNIGDSIQLNVLIHISI